MDKKNLFIGLITILLAYVSFLMVKPFIGYVLGAIIMAFILHPLHLRIRKRIDERISAFSLVTLSVILAFIPFVLMLGAVTEDAESLQNDINDLENFNTTGVEISIQKFTGIYVDIQAVLEDTVKKLSEYLFGGASAIIRKITSLFIGTTLMLFLMYYMIKDGDKFMEWLKKKVPVSEGIQKSYYDQLSKTTWAVVKGHVFIALAQGLLGGLGLFVAGVPNYVFWTFMMVILSFIPVIGAFIIWMPAAIYLAYIGDMAMSTFLLVYGVVIVSMVDNFLRPLAVDKNADLHPAAIIIGVLGGLSVFGAVGLFIGPIALGAFKSIIDVIGENEG